MNLSEYEEVIRQNCIAWNKKEFFIAINDERWRDAARYKGNIEKLEEQGSGDSV